MGASLNRFQSICRSVEDLAKIIELNKWGTKEFGFFVNGHLLN